MDRQDIHTSYEFDIDNDVNIPQGNNNTTILKQSKCYLAEPELKTKKGYPFMPTFSFTLHPRIHTSIHFLVLGVTRESSV